MKGKVLAYQKKKHEFSIDEILALSQNLNYNKIGRAEEMFHGCKTTCLKSYLFLAFSTSILNIFCSVFFHFKILTKVFNKISLTKNKTKTADQNNSLYYRLNRPMIFCIKSIYYSPNWFPLAES